jgi:hypothetical protein
MVPADAKPSTDTWLFVKFAYTFWPTPIVGRISPFSFKTKTKNFPEAFCAVIRFWGFKAMTVQQGPFDAGVLLEETPKPGAMVVTGGRIGVAAPVLTMEQQDVLPSSETCFAVRFA